jgi:hypothetical protein
MSNNDQIPPKLDEVNKPEEFIMPDLSLIPKRRISKAEAVAALWKQGNLFFKLDQNQQEMYRICQQDRKVTVIGSSRRIGKSYFMTVLALETCLKTPGSIVKFVAPTQKDLRTIFVPLLNEIMEDAPKHLKPKFNRLDGSYLFTNGSMIQLAGADAGGADSIRGGSATLCLVDEAGFMSNLDYLVKSILLPTTATTKGKIVLASTPPQSMSHDFIEISRNAALTGGYFRRTIYNNPRLTKEDIDQLAEASGGYDSASFRREYMCVEGNSLVTIRTPLGEIKTMSIKELKNELSK